MTLDEFTQKITGNYGSAHAFWDAWLDSRSDVDLDFGVWLAIFDEWMEMGAPESSLSTEDLEPYEKRARVLHQMVDIEGFTTLLATSIQLFQTTWLRTRHDCERDFSEWLEDYRSWMLQHQPTYIITPSQDGTP